MAVYENGDGTITIAPREGEFDYWTDGRGSRYNYKKKEIYIWDILDNGGLISLTELPISFSRSGNSLKETTND